MFNETKIEMTASLLATFAGAGIELPGEVVSVNDFGGTGAYIYDLAVGRKTLYQLAKETKRGSALYHGRITIESIDRDWHAGQVNPCS